MGKFYIKVSKFLSFILRHSPDTVGIQLNEEGFTELGPILKILNEKYKDPNVPEITRELIEDIIQKSDKRRFEIVEGKIRAFYGHSVDVKITMTEADPLPPKLYHGTNERAYEKIKVEGISRQKRQYVHLSDSIKTAFIVGKRRTKEPLILEIDTLAAKAEGTEFYKSGDMYLSEYIPAKFITKLNKKKE